MIECGDCFGFPREPLPSLFAFGQLRWENFERDPTVELVSSAR